MGLFSQIFGSDRPDGLFRSEMQHLTNKVDHLTKNTEQLEEIRAQGLPESSECSLDLAFVTNTNEKARRLVEELVKSGYKCEFSDQREGDRDIVIYGQAFGIKMNAEFLTAWTDGLCDLAAKHDCEFCAWWLSQS